MERRILDFLADRYPASAQRRGGRPLRVKDWEKIMPQAFASADARHSFLDAMERLEVAGILRLFWKKHRKGDELASVQLANPRGVYEQLGRPVPEDLAALLKSSAEAAEAETSESAAEAGAAKPETLAIPAFFRFVADRADLLSERLTPRDIRDAVALFTFGRYGRDSLPIRALSIRLYRDSKRLEGLVSLLRPLLAQAALAGHIPLPERIYPEVALAGRGKLEFVDGAVWQIDGKPLTLSLDAAKSLGRILVSNPKPLALSVENKETFHAFARHPLSFDFLLCTGGRPNRAVRAVLRVLATSGFSVFHAGDLDADGIAILSEVHDLCGALPFGMDPVIFDRYLPWARDLDTVLVSRLGSVPKTAFDLPGIRGLAERIGATGKGVEQEIIDYGFYSLIDTE
jgi:hypothetical protein